MRGLGAGIYFRERRMLLQIVITKCEEPVDEPRGEVFRIALFDNKELVDTFHHSTEADVLDTVKSYLEDLRSA